MRDLPTTKLRGSRPLQLIEKSPTGMYETTGGFYSLVYVECAGQDLLNCQFGGAGFPPPNSINACFHSHLVLESEVAPEGQKVQNVHS